MGYVIFNDFRVGVDRRRSRVAGTPGSLWVCKNAHITRGGEIEKRKQFVTKYTLPPRTFGARVVAGTTYVFGSDSPPAVPAGVTYQRLQHPTSSDMTALVDTTVFDGLIYAVARYADGSVHHFYDGARVTAWDDGVVTAATGSLADVASQIAARINADSQAIATAVAASNVITITATAVNEDMEVSADAQNGAGNVVNDQTAVALVTQAETVSLPQIATVTLGGTLEIGDRFSVKVGDSEYGAGGNPSVKGTRVITHRSKVYALAGEIVYFCAIDDPTTWRSGVNGAGFINAATREEGSLELVGVGKYQTGLAFLSDNAVQIWTLDENPLQNVLVETLPNTGTVAGDSTQAYGNNDTFYLARSGLRSLRARDSSNSAFVSDVGNAIDSLLIDEMRTLGETATAAARAVIEPVDGRYWLAIGSKIYVLSHFPGAKVTAWSWYDPGFEVDAFSIDSGKIYVRSGDVIYLYGGDDGNTYDSTAEDNYEVVVGLPFQGGKRIADRKVVMAFDCAVTGTWLVEMLVDPRNESRKVVFGTIDEVTYPGMIYPASAEGSHFAMVLTCRSPGPATVANLALHQNDEESEVVP